ncbi:glycosyltransferase family 2 protein [Ekhidna sp. MALMAid0563]|uniref:glycosyltransferase family 2 protein n=1 Tax=Ekhidna sp. MALMAid0563 TaxID=3143937 RepID=UPI0032DF6B38
MVDTPLVSVVLPFYNAPFLKEAIESILHQSFQNFELVLVNNASTDESAEVAKSFASHDRVILIHEEQRGVAHAANAGIRASKGQFIARMDADDIAFPERLKQQVEMLEAEDDLGVASGLVEYLGPAENKGFIHYVNWLNTITEADEITLNQFVEFPIANPTTMIRKPLFDSYGMFEDNEFPEDYAFFLRLQSHGVKMKKVDQPVLKWRDTENRLTRTDKRYTQDAFFSAKAVYLSKWLKNHNPFHPQVWVWGAGRVSRRRSDYLKKEGITIAGYIDVKEGEGIRHYDNLPDKEEAFVVSYVFNRGARDEIRSFLIEKGYEEGEHFILAS